MQTGGHSRVEPRQLTWDRVIFAVLVAAQALTQIVPQMIAISKAAAAASDMFAIIDRESNIDSLSTEGAKIDGFKGDIKLRGLRFAYPSRPDIPVLHGLDLDVPPNKTTALVGASGSGKSTIFGLLERWYLPSGGSITLDDQPIEELNLQWLRTNIRLVQQVLMTPNVSRVKAHNHRNLPCSVAASTKMLLTALQGPK